MKHKIQIPCTVQVADRSEPAENHTIDLEVEAETVEDAHRIAYKAARQVAVDGIHERATIAAKGGV